MEHPGSGRRRRAEERTRHEDLLREAEEAAHAEDIAWWDWRRAQDRLRSAQQNLRQPAAAAGGQRGTSTA